MTNDRILLYLSVAIMFANSLILLLHFVEQGRRNLQLSNALASVIDKLSDKVLARDLSDYVSARTAGSDEEEVPVRMTGAREAEIEGRNPDRMEE